MAFFNRESRMNGYNFTERVRKVLADSRESAAQLGHEHVGTEHLLLALLRDDGVSSAVLDNLRVDRERVRTLIEQTVQRGTATSTTLERPYTSRAKKVLELSMAEARTLNHSYVGTEHLLLGLIGEGKGIAAQALADAGFSLERGRAETLRLLSVPGFEQARESAPQPSPASSAFAQPTHSLGIESSMDGAREQLAWTRLTHALDVCARTDTTPTLALEDDGTLTASLGHDLVISIDFPPGVRVRRRDDR